MKPIAICSSNKAEPSLPDPMHVFRLPSDIAFPAEAPTPTLSAPVVKVNALIPTPTEFDPVCAFNANLPIATF